jgi:hypothetical protein
MSTLITQTYAYKVLEFPVDYGKDVEELYEEFTKFLIRLTGRLGYLEVMRPGGLVGLTATTGVVEDSVADNIGNQDVIQDVWGEEDGGIPDTAFAKLGSGHEGKLNWHVFSHARRRTEKLGCQAAGSWGGGRWE